MVPFQFQNSAVEVDQCSLSCSHTHNIDLMSSCYVPSIVLGSTEIVMNNIFMILALKVHIFY